LLLLGFSVLTLPAFFGEVQPSPDAAASSPLQPSDIAIASISESAAREKCEEAVGRSPPGGVTPQFTASATGFRSLNGGRSIKVTFSAKNSRDVELDFSGWCEVWADGKTDVISVVEMAGRDFLASSHPQNIRNVYLQKVKTSKSQGDLKRFYTVITNRNDFSIKSVEVVCRTNYSDLQRVDDKKLKVERVIPDGGSTTFQTVRTTDAVSMSCRVTDFLKVGTNEQRLIDAFGPAGGQSSYSRLRQDAIRVGVSVDSLVEPFITFARTLASNQR
jgi:hypothetical protein